jgi:hypothetical protein
MIERDLCDWRLTNSDRCGKIAAVRYPARRETRLILQRGGFNG